MRDVNQSSVGYLDRCGRYTLLIEWVVYRNNIGFVIEFRVLKSEPVTVSEEIHPPGYRPFVVIGSRNTAAVKAFVRCVFDVRADSAVRNKLVEMVSDPQPARGVVIQADVRGSKAGRQIYWKKAREENTREAIEQRRCELDRGDR